MRSTCEFVTFGEAMLALLASGNTPLTRARTFERHIAGAESNVATGLARLEHNVRWIGRVGMDAFGDTVRATLRGEGVDISHVTTDDTARTGVLIRDVHPQRPIDVVYHRRHSAGSRLGPSDLPAAAFEGARVVLFSGITPLLSVTAREASHAAIDHAREVGATVVFDPNVRRRLAPLAQMVPILQEFARKSDIVLAGQAEADLLSGAKGSESARWFLAHNASLVVLKRGAAGAWATDGNAEYSQPAVATHVVDPVGAGDAFSSGFLSAWLDGQSLPEQLGVGAACAAACIAARGDTDGLPTRSQLTDALAGRTEARR